MAEHIARDTNQSVGQVVSELIMKAADSEGPALEVKMVDGWPKVDFGRRITAEEVQRLIDEDE